MKGNRSSTQTSKLYLGISVVPANTNAYGTFQLNTGLNAGITTVPKIIRTITIFHNLVSKYINFLLNVKLLIYMNSI